MEVGQGQWTVRVGPFQRYEKRLYGQKLRLLEGLFTGLVFTDPHCPTDPIE